jgi:hypothetical protein
MLLRARFQLDFRQEPLRVGAEKRSVDKRIFLLKFGEQSGGIFRQHADIGDQLAFFLGRLDKLGIGAIGGSIAQPSEA